MTTLRRERRQKFTEMLLNKYYLKIGGEYLPIQVSDAEKFAAELSDAAESRTEKAETPSPKPEVDKVAEWLKMSQYPGAKREARTDALLSYFAETLRRTTTSKEWLDFAKWVDNRQQKHGEKAQVFVGWLRGQPRYDPQFWPVSKMMEFWPSAFVNPEENKTTLEDSGWK